MYFIMPAYDTTYILLYTNISYIKIRNYFQLKDQE